MAIENRVATLERSVARGRAAVAVLLLFNAAVLLTAARPSQTPGGDESKDVVKAHAFVVVNGLGKTVAKLEAISGLIPNDRSGGGALAIYDPAGALTASLVGQDSAHASFTLWGNEGRAVVSLRSDISDHALKILGRTGLPACTIDVTDDGGEIGVWNTQGSERLIKF